MRMPRRRRKKVPTRTTTIQVTENTIRRMLLSHRSEREKNPNFFGRNGNASLTSFDSRIFSLFSLEIIIKAIRFILAFVRTTTTITVWRMEWFLCTIQPTHTHTHSIRSFNASYSSHFVHSPFTSRVQFNGTSHLLLKTA